MADGINHELTVNILKWPLFNKSESLRECAFRGYYNVGMCAHVRVVCTRRECRSAPWWRNMVRPNLAGST